MKKIVILQHVSEEGPGWLRELLPRLGFEFEIFHSYAGSPFPDLRGLDGVIALGGYMGANDEAAHPWIAKEIRWLKDALSARKKVFGICLGAQLLARAVGGHVERNPLPEIGWFPIRWKNEGLSIAQMDHSVVFQWHQDTFFPPETSALRWIADSEACPRQAYLWSDLAIGVQFHPEVNADELVEWVSHPEGLADITEKLRDYGGKTVSGADELVNSPAINYQNNLALLEKLLRAHF